jgi:hypothetical protein
MGLVRLLSIAVSAAVCAVGGATPAHAAPSPAEQAELDWLASQVEGKIAYCKGNAI